MGPPRLAVLLLAIAPGSIAAQSRTFDVGASHVSQTNQEPGSALILAGTVDAASMNGWLRTTALAVIGVRAQTSAQILIAGSRDLRTIGSVRPFVSATTSGFAENGTGASASADASAGVRYAAARYGLSVAAAGGAMTHGGASTTLLRAQSDAWMSAGYEQFSANVALTSTGARFDPQARLSGSGNTEHYFDVAGGWRHNQGPISLGFAIGRRNETEQLRGGVWQSSDAELWVEPRLALVVSGGNTLADVRRGIPRTTYMTVAFRFANRPHFGSARAEVVKGPRMVAIDAGDVRGLELRGVNGTRVELMADFTAWDPVSLERVGDAWRLVRTIPPGSHRLAIRVDGGPWIVPANLPKVADDLGGTLGLITTP